MLLAGCASSSGPATGPSPTATIELTVRGNILAAVGQLVATPVDVEAGTTLALTVRDIRVVDTCPGRGQPVQSPTLGQFVVIDVAAELVAEGGEDPAQVPSYAGLGAERFGIVDPDGVAQEVSVTDASWACFEDEEILAAFVEAGQGVSGLVALDSRTDHGTILFIPGEGIGWEWDF